MIDCPIKPICDRRKRRRDELLENFTDALQLLKKRPTDKWVVHHNMYVEDANYTEWGKRVDAFLAKHGRGENG